MRTQRVLAGVGAAILVAVGVQLWRDARDPTRSTAAPTVVDGFAPELDAQGRCEDALALVTSQGRWPMRCRWRTPADLVQGQAFPPPAGDPPFDDPHIEIYVDPAQSRHAVAHAIAHELGHMHHTRDNTRVTAWLAQRGLPPDTSVEVWAEDYAEVFARVFGPGTERWRAPTPPPAPEALPALKARFFAGA